MSHPTRRAALLGLAAAAPPWRARAMTLDRTARLVLGFPPGGASDVVCRLMADRMAGLYAPQVVVENKPGAAGRLSIEAVKVAAPDGATILFTPETMLTIYPHLYRRTLRYDGLTDFIPVSGVTSFGFGFCVAKEHPAKDIAGFAAWARRQGQPVPYASPAAGSGAYFAAENIARAFDIPMAHVAYRGMGPAYPDIYSGQLAGGLSVTGDLVEQVKGGRLRVLVVTTPERSPGLPEVPTMAALGRPDLTIEEQFGVLLPAGTPRPIVESLYGAIEQVFRRPDMKEALTRMEQSIVISTPPQFAQRIRSERERWGPIVRATGYTVEE